MSGAARIIRLPWSSVENQERNQLSPNETAILRAIDREGRILTLIKELAYGDVESLHFPATVVAHTTAPDNDGALSDAAVLEGLHSLEQRGMVTCSLTVHRVSTTEYICEWSRGEAAAAGERDASAPPARLTQPRTESNNDILRAS